MRRIWIAGVLFLTPSLAAAQVRTAEIRDAATVATGVTPLHLMPPERFEAAGLTKLSHSELQVLAQWVRTHALMVGQLAYGAAAAQESAVPAREPASVPHPGVIETRLTGDFTGWDGATVFHLANGQAWQQNSFGSLHHYERSPNVTLVATPAGWRMEVEGISQTIYVRRIR